MWFTIVAQAFLPVWCTIVAQASCLYGSTVLPWERMEVPESL
ncbi:hypothetical protein SBA4_880045 [Candidatus Sulfopaludibacter sp. SbA4]|nr:hypothetical protein SBA4_880045 [Candidatus Sulfopaludibacter sp. SbA4]